MTSNLGNYTKLTKWEIECLKDAPCSTEPIIAFGEKVLESWIKHKDEKGRPHHASLPAVFLPSYIGNPDHPLWFTHGVLTGFDCKVVEKDCQVHRDENMRLHHYSEPALVYPDGERVWLEHGEFLFSISIDPETGKARSYRVGQGPRAQMLLRKYSDLLWN